MCIYIYQLYMNYICSIYTLYSTYHIYIYVPESSRRYQFYAVDQDPQAMLIAEVGRETGRYRRNVGRGEIVEN